MQYIAWYREPRLLKIAMLMLYIQNHYHNFWGSSFTLPFFKVDSIPGILKVGRDAKESPFWMRNQAEEGLENQSI